MENLIYALGGGDEVGGSSYFLQFDCVKILIDAGARMRDGETLIDYEQLIIKGLLDSPEEISAVIITHGHLDHIGSIMNLFKFLPESTPVYMTKITREILRFQIRDSFKHQEREFECELNIDEDLLFSRLFQAVLIEDNETIDIEDVECTFLRAGHIMGAVSLFLKTPWLKIFWTADFCNYDQLLTKGCDYSACKGSYPDYIVSESTYGEAPYEEESAGKRIELERAKLVDTINGFLDQNGRVLIPAFAVGRSQEIIKLLTTAIKSKKLHTPCLYVGGSAYKMTDMLIRDFNLPIDRSYIESFNWYRVQPKFANFSGVIVASSGMMTEGSLSYRIAEEMKACPVPGRPSAILFSGYLDAESPGRRLLNMETAQGSQVYTAQFRLSAHAQVNGILDQLQWLGGKNWLFIHGEGNRILTHAQNRKKFQNLQIERIDRLANGTVYPFLRR